MAKGMNAGIFTLLFVIMVVLFSIAIFFAYIIRRAARMNAAAASQHAATGIPSEPAQPISQPTT